MHSYTFRHHALSLTPHLTHLLGYEEEAGAAKRTGNWPIEVQLAMWQASRSCAAPHATQMMEMQRQRQQNGGPLTGRMFPDILDAEGRPVNTLMVGAAYCCSLCGCALCAGSKLCSGPALPCPLAVRCAAVPAQLSIAACLSFPPFVYNRSMRKLRCWSRCGRLGCWTRRSTMQPSRQVRFDGHHGTGGSKQAPHCLPCSGTCGASPLAAAALGSNWRLPLAIATSERALTPLLCTTHPTPPLPGGFRAKGYWPEGLLPKNEMRKRMEVGCGGLNLLPCMRTR